MKRIFSLVLALLLLLCPMAQAEEAVQSENKAGESATVLKALRAYVQRNFQFGASQTDFADAIIEAILAESDTPETFEFLADAIMSACDEHSVYFTPEETREFNEYVDASFGGVGVSLASIDGYCTVLSILPGTPADGSGLVQGDKIVAVNGENVVNMDLDLIIKRTRGEVGTDVTLTILSENGATKDMTFTRNTVVTPSVDYVVNDTGDVAYLQIIQFAVDTAAEFKQSYAEIQNMGIRKIIIDIRDNTGGYTSQASEIASMFLPQGSVIYQESINAYNVRIPEYAQNDAPDLETELVLLVNDYSASASEILTGALKENDRAKVIGINTFGKGTMQTVSGLGEYGSTKLTIAEFMSPKGNTINKVGIAPNIRVENTTRAVEDSDLLPLSLGTKYFLGDENQEILAIKQRLAYLGWYTGDADSPVFDKDLELAVRRFQGASGLYPYGVADINTQLTLQVEVKNGEIYVDNQFERACKELGTTQDAFK